MADLLQPLPVRSWSDRLALLRDQPWFRPATAAGGAVLAVAVLVAGPTPGRASSCSAVAVLRSTGPMGAAPGLAPPDAGAGVATTGGASPFLGT